MGMKTHIEAFPQVTVRLISFCLENMMMRKDKMVDVGEAKDELKKAGFARK